MNILVYQTATLLGGVLCIAAIAGIGFFAVPIFPEGVGIYIVGWLIAFVAGTTLPIEEHDEGW